MSKQYIPERIENSNRICDYGCGQEAKYKFNNGKWCCEVRYHKCPSKRKIQSIAQQKRDDLKEQGRRLGKSNRGRKHGFTIRKKLSNIQKERAKSPEERKRRSDQQKEYHENLSKEDKTRYSLIRSNTVERIAKNHPLLIKIEELREDPISGRIQGRCKNHNCINSKEKDGWFTLVGRQLEHRMQAIENQHNNEGNYFYCSDECKNSCSLYGKSATQLINEDKIKAGIIKELPYTASEYDVWRQEVLKRADYKCEFCGEPAKHCHHSRPQKLEPFFSLDPEYGIACCIKCHYEKGHRDECSTGQIAYTICPV